MSGFLLDTNIISKFAPGRPEITAELRDWMHRESSADRLFLSAMTTAEISRGVNRLLRKGATAKAAALSAWLEGILSSFEDQILPMDPKVSLLTGELEDAAVAKGFDPVSQMPSSRRRQRHTTSS